MKKLFLLSAISGLGCLAPLPAQNLLIPLLQDSSHWYYYNNITGDQDNYSRAILFFNAQNQETGSFTESTWTGSPTVYYRDTVEYDANGNAVRQTTYNSTNTAQGPWEYWLKDSIDYDAQGRQTHIVGYYGNAGEWIPYYNIFYGFDDANHADSMLYLLWNPGTGHWDNYNREATYRSANGSILEFHRQMWDATLNNWKDARNDYYTYQPDGRLLVVHTNEFDSNDTETITTDSSVYGPTGLLDTTFLFIWIDDLNFNNLIIRDYNYDQNGDLSSTTSIRSPDGGITFIPASRQFFEPGDGYYSNDYSFESQETALDTDTYQTNWETTRTFTPLSAARVLYKERTIQNGPNNVLIPNLTDSVWYRLPGVVSIFTPGAGAGIECRFANPFRPGNTVVCDAPDKNSALTFRLSDRNGRQVGTGNALPGTAWRPSFQVADGVYQLGVWQHGVYLGGRKMIWIN